MPTTSEALAAAVEHHQAGRLETAEQLYRQILAVEPNNADALNRLGVIAYQVDKYELAANYIHCAIEINGSEPSYHCNLGIVFLSQHRLDEAVDCFRRTLELDPNHALAHYNLGVTFQTQGKLTEAIACFQRALKLNPFDSEVNNNLGTALRLQGSLNEAIFYFRRSLELKPDSAAAHFNLGSALQAQGNLTDAVVPYRRAIELKCDFGEAHSNLGTVLQSLGRIEDAIACYRQSATLTDLPDAHYNLGSILQSQGYVDEAIDSYHRALALRPDYAEAHNNLALLMLLKGDYQRGWTEYEWRWKASKLNEPSFAKPRWNGEPLENRAILLHAEQGLGDTIQFVRYAAIVKMQNPAATIIVKCQRRLAKLLATVPYIDRLIAEGDNVPTFDVHSPFFSLPLNVGTTVKSIPADIPYLVPHSGLVEQWRHRLAEFKGLRVGINWRGRSMQGPLRRRDIPLEFFVTLAQLSGVTLISLQKNETRKALTDIGPSLPIVDFGPEFDTAHGAFMDTAAVMMNIHLVITSDTAVAHLAGALGVPVWLALPFVSDWRWLMNRTDSPWYPTMRLFRQKQPGNWASVFEEIKVALYERLRRATAGKAAMSPL
jgi:tetratricopeptide (TPR) repeat protein